VEADGIEPTTPCLQSRCSPTELRPRPHKIGQFTSVAHTPMARTPIASAPIADTSVTGTSVVGPGRFELPTSRLSSARSNQLSYEPGSLADYGRDTPAAARFRSMSPSTAGTWTVPGAPAALQPRELPCGRLSTAKCTRTDVLRKEVIQPQVPLRLPCYDFTPVADPTVAGCLLAVSAPS
jgi:hypothetical protein